MLGYKKIYGKCGVYPTNKSLGVEMVAINNDKEFRLSRFASGSSRVLLLNLFPAKG